MRLSVIIGPEQPPSSSTRNVPPPLPPLSHRLTQHCTELVDYRILYRLQHQTEPEHIWKLISKVVMLENPRSKRERDRFRVEAWQRVKAMMRVGIAELVQRHYVRVGPVIPEWRKDVGSALLRRVGRKSSRKARHPERSKIRRIPTVTSRGNRKRSHEQFVMPTYAPVFAPNQSGSTAAIAPVPPAPTPPAPSMDDAKLAAKRLAAHRWKLRHRLTGTIGGQRVWQHQTVAMPDGSEARLVFAHRGRVLVSVGDVLSIDESKIIPSRAHEITLISNPSAVVLGRLKRGKLERPSQQKVEACRRNGSRPVRPGSRRRGRPIKSAISAGAVQQWGISRAVSPR